MEEKDDVFKQAKMVPLLEFLERINGKPGKPGSAGWIRFDTCPACGAGKRKDERLVAREGWSCHSCGEKGDVIAAAAFFWKVKPIDAARMLVTDYAVVSRHYVPSEPRVDDVAEQKRKALLGDVIQRIADTLRHSELDAECVKYLHVERKIPLDVIREAQHNGMLVTLPCGSKPDAWHRAKAACDWLVAVVGKQVLHDCGLWKEGSKIPAICFRPIIFVSANRRSAEFRLAQAPKDDEPKSIRYGDTDWWIWRGKVNGARCAVVEGCIDLMSLVALGYAGSIYGLPGCNSWVNWKAEKLSVLDGTVHIFLDNDDKAKNPGQKYAKELSERLQTMGRIVQNRVPPVGR